jgi:hypothetical protein
MSDADLKWVATLSDGSTAVEHEGEYTEVPGERKPWVRLVQFAGTNDLHLTSLRINFRGRTVHMPRSKFERFGYEAVAPLSYSVQYHAEVEMDTEGVLKNQSRYIDLAAHFPQYSVHYIQDIEDGNNSWVLITQNDTPLAESPRHWKEETNG